MVKMAWEIMSNTPQQIKIKMFMLPGVKAPEYKHEGDSGMDVCAFLTPADGIVIRPGEHAIIPTGVFVAVPNGYEIQVRSRSGLAAKNGICVLNSPGTVDASYRGECKVILLNTGTEDFTVHNGDRIAQLVLCPVYRADVEMVTCLDDLSRTDRGDGGFGSTGV